MTTYEKQSAELNAELVEFDKTFDKNDYESCVNRAILMLKFIEAQITEEGTESFPVRWPIELLERAPLYRKIY